MRFPTSAITLATVAVLAAATMDLTVAHPTSGPEPVGHPVNLVRRLSWSSFNPLNWFKSDEAAKETSTESDETTKTNTLASKVIDEQANNARLLAEFHQSNQDLVQYQNEAQLEAERKLTQAN
ncbi:hypothetical protein H4R33_004140 [Dimargaris cristalligena]|uniref:Uncharacterized protein n=1 Tax=Dimargaris cristalligena TaxID=215637 RepID=A0A4P9ZT85_9FUNG|nr:hypothetical protein H4R33_004140 [Dimargaris cristalligena]RKP35730.1 hypothetical protein BJ085DRAFT_28319 [Dimargaris cristalligena]|eukprot:RKP35730.1 hypothetical protein BJ085DRAFT_28319 [Dimargaris cristalligena]